MTDEPLRFVHLAARLDVLDASRASYAGEGEGVAVRVTLTVDEWERRDRPTSIDTTLDLGEQQ